MRARAYEEVGGYFTELFYGHEEVEMCWRLVDAGWRIRYLADVRVFHPRTDIGRHVRGWRLTGRNRVWVARRTLPWPVAAVHVAAWFVLGVIRAPDSDSRRSYVSGWLEGWQGPHRAPADRLDGSVAAHPPGASAGDLTPSIARPPVSPTISPADQQTWISGVTRMNNGRAALAAPMASTPP